jgi:hypothetical protein
MFYNYIIICYFMFSYLYLSEIVIGVIDTTNQRIGQVKAGTTIMLQWI